MDSGWLVLSNFATSLLSFALVLVGGGVVVWVLSRPQLRVSAARVNCGWYVIHRDGQVLGRQLRFLVHCRNDGEQDTTIMGTFRLSADNESEYPCNEAQPLRGHGTQAFLEFVVDIPKERLVKYASEAMEGRLRLTAWGSRRFWIGRESESINLVVPRQDSLVYEDTV